MAIGLNICTNTQHIRVSWIGQARVIFLQDILRKTFMATRAEAIDLLIDKGQFEPQVALAVVEAVAVMMTEAQIVTVPVLDARLAEIRADIVQLDHKVDVVNTSLEGKIELCRTGLEGKIELLEAKLGKLIESTKAELVRWVFLAMLGSGAIQAGAAALINAVQHH